MLHFRFFHFIPIFILYLLVVYLLSKRRKTSLLKELVNLSFFIYILLLFSITILPIPIDPRLIQNYIETNTEAQNIFIPFHDIYRTVTLNSFSVLLKQVIGNIVLFLPLGFYAPLVWFKIKSFKQVMVLGFLISLGIESLQMLISLLIGMTYRSFVVDDIILNVLGVGLGFLIFTLIRPVLRQLINFIDKGNEINKNLIG
jgi:glycopeptide antibiotics resistance protein